jgi:death-on-curing protein
MIILTIEEIIITHNKLIAATGGSAGLRDSGLLESAVLNCYQTFDDEELYPSIIEKAARLAFGICKNHPFVDGNKRIAVTSLLVMLRLNDVRVNYTQSELITLGLGIADGSLEYEDILQWVHNHLVEYESLNNKLEELSVQLFDIEAARRLGVKDVKTYTDAEVRGVRSGANADINPNDGWE